MQSSAARVWETNDYKKFHLLEFNRDVKKVAPLLASMAKHGWINSKPMSVVEVNGKMKIKDGHHRFQIARQLGIPVKYVIDTDSATIYELDKSTNKWSMQDTLVSYVRAGNPDYIKIKEYCDITGINIEQAISMMIGHQASSGNAGVAFREGRYVSKDHAHAYRVGELVLCCKRYGVVWAHHSLLVTALSKISFVREFSHNRLKSKIKSYPYLITKQPHLDGYLEMIEHLYNFKSQDKIPLKFLAEEAAKKRNVIKK